jgi:class 3 adenylate cyclase
MLRGTKPRYAISWRGLAKRRCRRFRAEADGADLIDTQRRSAFTTGSKRQPSIEFADAVGAAHASSAAGPPASIR